MSAERKGSARSSTMRARASVADEPVTSVLGRGSLVLVDAENGHEQWREDEEVLAALGYKAEFKREFSLWTSFSVSFSVLGLLPSFASTLLYGMGYAGTAGMTWGFLIAMIGIQCVAMGMAEICSSMPTSGGLYYAAAVLAPPGWGPLAAWITGWSNWLGQITSAPSVNYGTASMILAAASINNPDYTPENYQVFLVCTLLQVTQSLISSLPTRQIAQINSWGSTFNMLAAVAVIILIPAATTNEPKFHASSEVWGTIYQGTDWPNGIAILMSFVAIIWTLSGYDAPFHLSEECSNANVASPRAIVLSSTVGGSLAWFLSLVVAYTVNDIEAAIDSDLGQPFAAYLIQSQSKSVTLAILSMTIIAGFFMGQGCMVAASRVTFAYARDDVFPFSNVWKKVNSRTKTPVNAVMINMVIGVLLTLLIFGGPLAIGALFSIGAIAQYAAFTVPIFIRLFFAGNRFKPGPWNLGRYTWPIGSVACAFVTLMLPILCFPEARGSDLNVQNMNWTCLVYGAPMALAGLWWILGARKWFKGPKINIEHVQMGDDRHGVEKMNGLDAGSDGLDSETSSEKGREKRGYN